MANETDVNGILNNLQYGSATGWTISGNTVTNTDGATSDSVGMQVWSIQTAVSSTMSNNTVVGFDNGYLLWNGPSNGVVVSGGSVTGSNIGVLATNYAQYGDASSGLSAYTISGVAISGCAIGVKVDDSASNITGATVSVAVSGGSISGGTTGLLVSGADASVSSLATTAFSGQSGNYITLAGSAGNINATSATFGG